MGWLKRGTSITDPQVGVPSTVLSTEPNLEVFMSVIIGVDPHKASHTAVAIGDREDELAIKKVRATKLQVEQLLSWARPFP